MKKLIVLTGFVILCGFVILNYDMLMQFTGQNKAEESRANGKRGGNAVKVITAPVEITSNDLSFEAVGTGRARLSVAIYPSVADEVMEINFKAQDMVKKGDVLVQLDDREEKLAVRLAEVEIKDAKSLLGRYEQAVKEGAVPESEVDAARATYDAAQVALDQANLALEERQIIAPFDGVVGIPNVDPGDRVSTDTMITGLDDRSILHIDFEVPEALAGVLKNSQSSQQKITARTPAYPDKIFEGYISAQESRVDAQRRTMMARATIDNEDDLLRPGMSFETIWLVPGADYATVPEISVQWGRDGSFIWLIKDNKAVKTPARVIARKDGRVLLEGDISKGDQVVVEGLQRLRPEMEVEILGQTALGSAS